MICFILAKEENEFNRYKAGTLTTDSYIEEIRDEGQLVASIILRVLAAEDGQKGLLFVVWDRSGKKDNCKEDFSEDAYRNLLALLFKIMEKSRDIVEGLQKYNKAIYEFSNNYLLKCLKLDELDSKTKNSTTDTKRKGHAVLQGFGGFVPNPKQEDAKVTLQIDEETIAFIHWGGGLPATHEEKFASFLERYCKSPEALFTKLRAYAFSSRRAELFDVTKPKIDFPKTIEEGKNLERKFKAAQKISGARKIMTEYVLAVQNKIDKESQQFDVFCDAVKEVVAKMAEEWESGYLEEDEQARRAELVAEYNKAGKANSNKIADLFKTILFEEAKNG